ncbi:MAG: endo-1,4-beta-xylanase [Saprospiraceae bacterium]
MLLELDRHAFGWGTAVNSEDLLKSPDHLKAVSDFFNVAVFENDLKIKRWQNKDTHKATIDAIDLLALYGVQTKGHVLMADFQYLPERVRNMEQSPQKVVNLMNQHLQSIVDATKGKISRWDVINILRHQRDLQRITGSNEILYNGFRILRDMDPAAERFINEYGIISKGGHDVLKQDWYYQFIQEVDAATGGLVDGIGMQCHIGSDLTAPTQVLAILDRFGSLGKKIAISEFTLDIDDPEVRYNYTRDFMIAAFSHPSVHDFLFWGYYEPNHPKAAILPKTGRQGNMSWPIFFSAGLWKTRIEAATDAGGRIQGRGSMVLSV